MNDKSNPRSQRRVHGQTEPVCYHSPGPPLEYHESMVVPWMVPEGTERWVSVDENNNRLMVLICSNREALIMDDYHVFKDVSSTPKHRRMDLLHLMLQAAGGTPDE